MSAHLKHELDRATKSVELMRIVHGSKSMQFYRSVGELQKLIHDAHLALHPEDM